MVRVVSAFPFLLVSCAVLLAVWIVLVALQRIRLARFIEALAVISAALTACSYLSIWGLTLGSIRW